MSAFSSLVDVQFKDATSYPATTSGDVVLLPFWHFWGPVGKKDALNQTDFMQTYCESIPPIYKEANFPIIMSKISYLNNYVECKRAFEGGASSVIGCRLLSATSSAPSELVWKFGSDDGGSTAIANTSLADSDSILKFKYPGVPTCVDLGIDSTKLWSLSLKLTIDGSNAILEFKATEREVTNPQVVVIEAFSGSLNSQNAESANDPYIGTLIEENSQFFSDFKDPTSLSTPVTSTIEWSDINETWGESGFMPAANPMDVAGTYTDIKAEWSDPQVTSFTLFLMPSHEDSVMTALQGIVPERKDSNVIWGYPVNASFTKSDINTYYSTKKSMFNEPSFFALFLEGRELVKAFNTTFKLDGKALWAGRMVTVAKSVRLNQMPSAWRYGMCSAVLDKTLTFNEVIELHELGINSLFLSTSGPCFFGIKAVYPRQTSYYAKANVSRVSAKLVRSVIPEVMQVIHSEVVSDPIERAKFQTTLNGIVSAEIADGNIKEGSYASVDDSINTDKTTKGGEVLNVLLMIYFKKLAERVKISIVATDSSVQVNIS